MPKRERINLQASRVSKGTPNPKAGGYFVDGNIPTFRCPECLQHMSLFEYSISTAGAVSPDVVCPNPTCGAVFKGLVLNSIGKFSKKPREVFLK